MNKQRYLSPIATTVLTYAGVALLVLLITQMAYFPERTSRRTFNLPSSEFPRNGFHMVEHFASSGQNYSWTMGDATLTVPNPGKIALLQLSLAGGPGRSVPVQIDSTTYGVTLIVQPELRRYHLLLPRQSAPDIVLHLHSPIMHEHSGTRTLGVLVSTTVVSGHGPAPAVLVATLLVGAVALVLAFQLAGLTLPIGALGIVALCTALAIHLANGGWQSVPLRSIYVVCVVMLIALAVGIGLAQRCVSRFTNGDKIASDTLKKRAPHDAGAVAVLWLTAVMFFLPYLISGKTLIAYDILSIVAPWRALGQVEPQNNLMSDVIRLQVPWHTLLRDALAQGEIPFWNHYVFGGMPFMANQQSGVFYPFNYIFQFVTIETGFLIYTMLHLFLAGLGMYLLLRQLRHGSAAALAGGITWLGCGFLTVWLPWLSIMATPIWLPWGVLAVEHIIASGSRRAIAGLAVAVGLTLLAGHAQFAYYSLLTIGAFALWRVFTTVAAWRSRAHRMLMCSGGAIIGVLIALPQLGPTFELAALNTRTPVPIAIQMAGAMPLKQLATLVVPDFFGNVNAYFGAGNFVEYTGYVGLVGLALAVIALLHPNLTRRSAFWFFAGCAVIGLHVAYGGLLNIPLSYFPGCTSFRGLQRLYMVWSFSVAGMVAWGVEAALTASGRRKALLQVFTVSLILLGVTGLLWISQTQAWLTSLGWKAPHNPHAWISDPLVLTLVLCTGTGAVLAALLMAGRAAGRGRMLAFAPAVLIGFDLLHFSHSYLPMVDPKWAFPDTPGIAYLKAHRDEGRIMRFGEGVLASPLTANTSILYGIDDLDGSDSFTIRRFNELIGQIEPARYTKVSMINSLGNFEQAASLASPILDVLSVRFMLTEKSLAAATLHQATHWQLVYRGADMTIYRNDRTLPMASIVGNVQVMDIRHSLLPLRLTDSSHARW